MKHVTERFYEACAGAPCLTKNPRRKYFLADGLQETELDKLEYEMYFKL